METVEELEALVIGAGVTGLYALHRLLKLGLRAKIYETGDGVGGTWYWNRSAATRDSGRNAPKSSRAAIKAS